ncbi:MAG: hypothetical protein AB2693_29710 [Candidatus Thiodiazotropha sp.]
MKPVAKLKFSDEFKSLYNIDVQNEDTFVHPANICYSHTGVLYRFRSAKKSGVTFSTSMTISEFTPHINDNCNYCLENLATQPGTKKKMMTTPGRGKRSKLCIDLKQDECKTSESNILADIYESMPSTENSQVLENFILNLSSKTQLDIIELILKKNIASINKDIETIQNTYRSVPQLKELNVYEYINQRNKTIVTVLESLTMTSLHDDCLRLSVILESIYKLRNARFLGPVSMLQNLTVFSMTNSKTAVDVMGNFGAGGKYSALCKWLDTMSSIPTPFPKGDTLVVFDNEQVIGKTWNIRPQNKIKTSIITTVAAAQLDKENIVEQDSNCHPKTWFTQAQTENVVAEMVAAKETFSDQLRRVHMDQFKIFIRASIEQILEEQSSSDKEPPSVDVIDKIVEKLQQEREFKTCLDCNILVSKSKRKCPTCKKDLVKYSADSGTSSYSDAATSPSESISFKNINFDKKHKPPATDTLRYDHIPSGHSTDPIPVCVLDPVFVNPNSFDSLKLVLRHIGNLAGIKRYGGTEREWVIVCCDGLPYTMVFRMIQEYLTCTTCNSGFLGSEQFEQHKKQHPGVNDVQYIREFDWVMLHTGDGHYEMNLMKAFVELNWDVFMAMLAKRMGWTSESALKAAKLCYDNHKTWQLILVFHFGSLLELLTPYLRQLVDQVSEEPTPNGFLKFTKSMEGNPTYMYLFQMVSRYSQAIVNMRMGVRRNNSVLIQSAKFMSKGLFHGRTHPRYQQIEMVESIQRQLLPEKLKEFMKKHESISRSDCSKGQGYDFILEEINKGVKSWIRRGVASDNMWLNVCRNYDQLLEIRGKIISDSDGNSVRKLDLEDAITDWRVCLREKNYCTGDSLIHKSLSGDILHKDLVNFTAESERKRNYRLMEVFLHQESPDDISLKHPVFVTDAEAEKFQAFENQTVPVIQKMILDFIQSMADQEKRATYTEKFRKEVLKKSKMVHIQFFNEVLEAINETTEVGLASLEDAEEV